MKDLVEYIVKQIVNNPEAVVVEENQSNEAVSLRLTVDPADMGIVIGKAGQTIKAIRKLLTIRAIADNVRVNLELAEPSPEKNQSLETSLAEETDQSEAPSQLAVPDALESSKK